MSTKPSLAGLTLIEGSETLLVIEAADAVREAAREYGFIERHSFVMDARSDWEPVFRTLGSGSLFGDRPLVEITLPTGKPGRPGGQAIQTLATEHGHAQAQDAAIIFKLPTLDRQIQSNQWYKTLKSRSRTIACPSIGRHQLVDWIRERLAAQEQSADPQALAWMAEHVEGNLLAAHQEILKLGLLHGPGQLEIEAVQAAVMDVARFDVNTLREAVVAGDGTRALRILAGLQGEGQVPLLVLWGLTQDLQQLDGMLQAMQQGTPQSQAMRDQGLFGQRQDNVRTLSRRLNAQQVSRLLAHAHDIDRLIKGIPSSGRLNDAWAELERLAVRIAQA